MAEKSLSKTSGTTQAANTVPSYVRAANLLKALNINTKILDYGAGLGTGSDAMRKILSGGVDSFELNPERWKGSVKVTYTKSSDIKKKYAAIVCLNVLNVVPKDVRDFIVRNIYSHLSEGGIAIISARGFKGDIDTVKNFKLGSESKSYIVKRREDGKIIDVYQKGFDNDELFQYVKLLLGSKVGIIEKNSLFGVKGVIITKK